MYRDFIGVCVFIGFFMGCGVPQPMKTEPKESPEASSDETVLTDVGDKEIPSEVQEPSGISSEKPFSLSQKPLIISGESSFPFAIGEQLEYEVTWFGIQAGTILMEVIQPEDDSLYLFRVYIQSSPGFSVFYRINDLMEIFVDKKTLLPSRIVLHRDEGRRRGIEETFFYRDRGEVEVLKEGERKGYAIPPEARDGISAIYLSRMASWGSGGSIRIPVFSNKKTYEIEVKALRKERIKTLWGETETLVVLPEVWDHGKKQEKGEVYFWLTEDSHQVPVQIRGKVKIGSLFLRLKNYRVSEEDAS
ncbi:MAG: DUF3108 domain-containing protein [Deltaproteobacteria bacterium]|nr:DUF3108 domain-containing protein [Deltaproteobacteria bacterium]